MHSKLLPIAGLLAASFCFSGAAQAQSIDPGSYSGSIKVGESLTIHKTITLGATGATNVDVFFLADNTGSMSSTVYNAQNGATTILNNLPSSYRFGVGRYYGDPSEGCSAPECGYSQLTGFTTDKTTVQTGINAWNATGGNDYPEANFYALKTVANDAGWDPSAQRLIVWFGDAPSHTTTVGFDDTVTALKDNNIKLIGFNNDGAGDGIDDSYGGSSNQASTLIDAVGGNLVNNFGSVSSTDFINAVTSQITSATSTIDLNFGSTYVGSGLEISYVCTDALGCDDVSGGESRTFDVTIKGLAAGSYDFKVFAQGVSAFETDRITVTAVPEPETYAMFLAGLGLLGVAARRRKAA